MLNTKKSIYLLLLAMGSIFWFRFNILSLMLTAANKNEVIRSFAPQYLPDLGIKYFNLFNQSDKNLLIGSSVFHAYIESPHYFRPEFNDNFNYYARVGESYLQLFNEIPLIRGNKGKNLIFFLIPGEIGVPGEANEFSWVIRPISYSELIMHSKILKPIYDQKPMYFISNFYITKVVRDFVFNSSRADSFLFSFVKHNIKYLQTLKFQLSRYNRLYYYEKKPYIPYSESLYQFDPTVKLVSQRKESFDVNIEYMDYYLKNLLPDYSISFVELPTAQQCEDEESLKTRDLFLKMMTQLSGRLVSPNFKFISRDQLPQPENFLFKDCIHMATEKMTQERYNFLKSYFESLSKKLNIPELQI